MKLEPKYQFLLSEKAPKMLVEALKWYGVQEIKGARHNPTIMGWADELGGWVDAFYTSDEIPWCGLYMGIVAKRAGYPHSGNILSAKHWLTWGVPVDVPMLGDVLVFSRNGGGHVGVYVGEDKTHYHVLGGNQDNAVNIKRLDKGRFEGARRSPFRIAQPANVRRVYLDSAGEVSHNEA